MNGPRNIDQIAARCYELTAKEYGAPRRPLSPTELAERKHLHWMWERLGKHNMAVARRRPFWLRRRKRERNARRAQKRVELKSLRVVDE